jgi:hypothetical protein
MLAQLTQRQAAQHEDDKLLYDINNSVNPGSTMLNRASPRFARLYAGEQPAVSQMVDQLTNAQMAAQQSGTQKNFMESYKLGVDSGNRVPNEVVQQQTNLPTQQFAPEAERLKGMEIAAAGARASQDRQQMLIPRYSATYEQDGTIKYGAPTIPPGAEGIVGATLLQLNDPANRATIARGTGGQQTVAGGYSPDVIGVPSGSKSKMPGAPVVIRPGSSTSAAGGALSRAPNETSAAPEAKAAPSTQGGGPFVTPASGSSAIANPNYVIDRYITARVAAGESPELLNQLKGAGKLSIGRAQDGQYYVTRNGAPVGDPLVPKQRAK